MQRSIGQRSVFARYCFGIAFVEDHLRKDSRTAKFDRYLRSRKAVRFFYFFTGISRKATRAANSVAMTPEPMLYMAAMCRLPLVLAATAP